MEFREVDKETEELIFDRRKGTEITNMISKFHKTNLKVAEISEEDVRRYKSPAILRQTINSALRKYNKKYGAFIIVCVSKGRVYLVNRSVTEGE